MDVLILSCSMGGGHDSAAKAILEEMKILGHNAVMFNPYTLKSDRLANTIDKAYVSVARSTPKLFGVIYKIGDIYRKLPCRSPLYFINRAMNKTMQEYLSLHHFDIVIITHLFGAEILTNMKNHGIKVPKMLFVATDYVCTPFTEEVACDAYIIPTSDIYYDFITRGIPKNKIYPYGIPTHAKFAEIKDKNAVRDRLCLKKDKKYILIAGGSMGGGNIKKAINKIQAYFKTSNDIELIVICGSNKQLYKKLKQQNDLKTTVIGYTNDMASYLKASDLFITKPGGLSSTEAAVCGVPILHTSAIPGCETCNARYFSDYGMSVTGNITYDILKRAEELLNDEAACKKMIERQRKYINPNAARDACILAEKLIKEEAI